MMAAAISASYRGDRVDTQKAWANQPRPSRTNRRAQNQEENGMTVDNSNTIWFADPAGIDPAQVGGKGAQPRPSDQRWVCGSPGVRCRGPRPTRPTSRALREKISHVLAKIDYNDAHGARRGRGADPRLDRRCRSPLPRLPARRACGIQPRLGDVHVAVRSSGTSEDLEGASFAGLHDTYLDIKGMNGVVDAVRRCWASLWTARAVSYRKSQGFPELPLIAVIVQTMVESEVSGVMFTANPINTATDQIMINASWGLGEAVVSGIVTPDEYIVRHRTLKLLDRTLGSKKIEVVRDLEKGSGTVHRNVEEARATIFTLNDEQVAKLADIGRRIQAAYEEMPQDIEWGYAQGQFYVLQARPITGVEFSWDADITESIQGNDETVPYHNIWSRVAPDEMWNGEVWTEILPHQHFHVGRL